ncbi:MAG TPA: transposase [Dissulfurispiraceae bacterium]|nr:transposase [Dissulfurispiraceae bacterium]
MARPLRILYPGAFYHVTSRGNEKKDIFKSLRDREKFLEYLSSASERYGAVIHAYCLMSNHFHLLLETPAGNLSQIMRHIIGAYTTYFNIKRQRFGHLFQGRYKALLVEADEYAAELTRYIHLNPVTAGIAGKPDEYKWSSYQSYIGKTTTPEWLKTGFILESFGKNASAARKNYRDFVEKIDTEGYEGPLKCAVGGAILGSPDFIEEITGTYLKEREKDKDIPALKHFSDRPPISDIIDTAKEAIKENEKLARQAGIYLCHKYSGASLKEIACKFDVGVSAIGEASKLFMKKMEQDASLRKQIDRAVIKIRKWKMES